jgi:hypothetical protein
LRRRAFAAAATALAVLPVLLYRNAFAYYYPVMMAPLTVLVALSFDGLLQGSARRDRAWMGPLALVLICLVVGVRAWDGLMTLRFDGQAGQRALVAGVHQVFPQPVPYLDHSGMIASFPKLNFFMSTWGVEDYLRGGTDFMPAALEARCPPLLLANHPVLRDGTLLNRQLRANDRRLLATYYVDYWGPIRLAGAELELEPGAVVTARVPCSGRYRIESEADLTIDGAAHRNSDVVELTGSRDIAVSAAGRQRMRLRWADAQVPPAGAPPQLPLYAPL